MENVDACINCGSRDLRRWVEGRDRLLGVSAERFAYAWCGGCGIALQSRRPAEAEIGRFYPEAYGPYQAQLAAPRRAGLRDKANRAMLRAAAMLLGGGGFAARIAQFYGRMQEGRRFLDFGCGSGKFLNRARKRGCTTIGMDFSPQALAEVERNGHVALPVSEAGWAALPDGTIDIVRMNHVVEHLYAPRETLARIFAAMRPGAGLHIAVPNPRGLSARLFGARWHGLDCPRHVVLYTADALARLLGEIGFRNVEILHEPLTKDLVRSWGYVLADLGIMRRAAVDATMASGPLNLLFALPGRLAWRTARGDRFHILAEKPG